MTRTQWILTGTLVLQILLLALFGLSGGNAGAHAPHALVDGLEGIAAGKIRIDEGDDDKTLVLVKSGETWGVEEANGYPAQSDKIDQLLKTLSDLNVRRPVVTGSRYHGALKVEEDDHERRLQIWEDGGGEPKVDLLLGTSPNYRVTHIRLVGDDAVYEGRGISAYDVRADAGSWIDKQFVSVDAESIVSVALRNSHGEFVLEKDRSGTWTTSASPGTKLDSPAVDSYVRSVASLYLSDPVGTVDAGAQGFDTPSATLTIVYTVPGESDGEEDAEPATGTVTLTLGGEVEGEEGVRYASRSGFDWAVTLSKFDTEKIVDKKIGDLVEQESDAG